MKAAIALTCEALDQLLGAENEPQMSNAGSIEGVGPRGDPRSLPYD
jgi:hypothetical protein